MYYNCYHNDKVMKNLLKELKKVGIVYKDVEGKTLRTEKGVTKEVKKPNIYQLFLELIKS
jgi:hypothetical protein